MLLKPRLSTVSNGNRTFRTLYVSPLHWTFRHQDVRTLEVSPLGRFAPRTFRPWTFRPLDVSPPSAFLGPYVFMCLLLFFALVNKVDWLMDWCTFFTCNFNSRTFTQLHATQLSFVETSTQMMALLMLSKIASIITGCAVVAPALC